MKFEEIERQAIALTEPERVDLVCKLLDTLPPAGMDVSDEEVSRRDAELDNGEVQELSHDEFVHRVNRERGE
jgi:putative addiction module component (TIGR02574 family)